MNVPVLFLVFNRPVHTRQAFAALRRVKPTFLFVAADGPREGNSTDEKYCAEVREIVKSVDWECEIKTLYRDKNLGTKIAVSSAIDWFFTHVEEGIIMEDDCIPQDDFYVYVSAMLARYRANESVMHINGTNLLRGKRIVRNSSYYFSNICHPWGWATWKRAWNKNDITMKDFPKYLKEDLFSCMKDEPEVVDYWYRNLDLAYQDKTKSWDYQWYFAFWRNHGIAVTPALNLISNIGFDEFGTNTFSGLNRFSKMKTYPMGEIVNPESIVVNKEADRYSNLQRAKELNPSLMKKIRFKMDIIMKKFS